MASELFDIDAPDSVLRIALRKKERISLLEFAIETYQVPDTYCQHEFRFPSDNYGKDIRQAIGPIMEEAEAAGYPSNLFTALYEAVLNAHQHGNSRDPKKVVAIAYKIDRKTVEIGIIDQGGALNPEFIPFVLRHREGRHRTKFLDFYEFTGQPRPKDNLGMGTSFMHTYVDNVQYFKSADGGLVVHLTKNNPDASIHAPISVRSPASR